MASFPQMAEMMTMEFQRGILPFLLTASRSDNIEIGGPFMGLVISML